MRWPLLFDRRLDVSPSALAAASSVTSSVSQKGHNQLLCREVTLAELAGATDNFSQARRLGGNVRGEYYRGSLNGTAVAVWVPHQRKAVPWPQMKAAADKLVALESRHLVPLKGISRDGCMAYELMLVSKYATGFP